MSPVSDNTKEILNDMFLKTSTWGKKRLVCRTAISFFQWEQKEAEEKTWQSDFFFFQRVKTLFFFCLGCYLILQTSIHVKPCKSTNSSKWQTILVVNIRIQTVATNTLNGLSNMRTQFSDQRLRSLSLEPRPSHQRER